MSYEDDTLSYDEESWDVQHPEKASQFVSRRYATEEAGYALDRAIATAGLTVSRIESMLRTAKVLQASLEGAKRTGLDQTVVADLMARAEEYDKARTPVRDHSRDLRIDTEDVRWETEERYQA